MSEIAQTADHALRILEELGNGEPLNPSQLCERLDLNRTVVHRLLHTLSARGFVLRQGAAYRPGVAIVRLAKAIEPDLRAIANPVMMRLADQIGESVVLHIVDGFDAVVLDQVVASRFVVRVSHQLGARHRLTDGASGRAILAFQPEAVVARALSALERPEIVRRSLGAVRQMGYALSHDELQDGVHGLAAPLLDARDVAVASLAVLVPTSRARGLEQHVDALWGAVQEIRDAYAPYLAAGESQGGQAS